MTDWSFLLACESHSIASHWRDPEPPRQDTAPRRIAQDGLSSHKFPLVFSSKQPNAFLERPPTCLPNAGRWISQLQFILGSVTAEFQVSVEFQARCAGLRVAGVGALPRHRSCFLLLGPTFGGALLALR